MRDSVKKLVLLLIAFLSVHLGATTFYVAKTGSDGNPGTEGLPLLTIQAGVNKANAGDTIMVLAGTYKEQVTFPRSGTEGLPITVRGEVDGGGNPLAIIDNTTPVGATWEPAPEVGAGVYKRVGFVPDLMLWDGGQIAKIHPLRMAGDTVDLGFTGFQILDFGSSATWHPYDPSVTTPFWPDVLAIYGVLGETTYIRYVDRSWDPDTCDLRAAEGNSSAMTLTDRDYITIEHLKLQGSGTPIVLDNSDHNIIQRCEVRNGGARIVVKNGSAENVIEHNDFTLGYGSYAHFGEWAGDTLISRRVAMYALGKFIEGYEASLDNGIVLAACGNSNVIDSNYIHRGNIGINLWSAPFTRIFGNTFNGFSSCGIYMGWDLESLHVYDNDIDHCNIALRIGSIGAVDPPDTNRSGYFYNNRSYNDSSVGVFLKFHGGGPDTTKPPYFWFYHNSYAGGNEWAVPMGGCIHMKCLNNIWSSKWLARNTAPENDTPPRQFEAFDYNFLGGNYKGYRYYAWAGYDRHNQWGADTMSGDVNHQVWPLGSEPDWAVPETSTAYRSGLDLSDSFTIRGVTYGPLPGMAPGYFTGDKPNLGAVQSPGRVGTEQRDPGHGSVAARPDLAFAPNPATSRNVAFRCVVPTAKVGKLTLRDVLGRTVKSIALVRSGISQLDLRGLAPGIYVAALDVGGPPVSRKLIITAH